MITFLTRGTAALLILVVLPAQADVTRSYLESRLLGTSGGGAFTDSDGQAGTLGAEVGDGLGWGLRGVWAISGRWHGYAEWGVSNTTVDVTRRDAAGTTLATEESDFDLERISLGAGYRWPVGEHWTWFGRLTWDAIEYADFDEFDLAGFGPVAIDDRDGTGVGATLGAQWVQGRWGFDVWARYSSVGKLARKGDGVKFDNDFGGGLRAVYHLTDSLSLGADYELRNIDTWSIVFRYRF